MERPLENLFFEAKQLLAILEGKEVTANDRDNKMLSLSSVESALTDLHLALAKAYPEAGKPYYRIRSWSLSCWQPIYLSLICVYLLKQVPNSLDKLRQKQVEGFIGGFAMPDGEWRIANKTELIEFAGQQLQRLFTQFQAFHQQVYGGGDPLYRALLADQLMEALVVAEKMFKQSKAKDIQNDYPTWARVLNLPSNPMEHIEYSKGEVQFTRYTCCLHYRRNDGDLCINCPRQKKKRGGLINV